MRYKQINDGDEMGPIQKEGHLIACCDCGLVHLVKPIQRGKKLYLKVWRDRRATAGKRRAKRFKYLKIGALKP